MIDAPQPTETDTPPDALQFMGRLGRIDTLRAEMEVLIARRARIEEEEDSFVRAFLKRFAPAIMPLTNNGTAYVIVRPSRRGNITRVGMLASTFVFRDAEGKVIPLVAHVDYQIFYNQKGSGLSTVGFEENAAWFQGVLDEIDQLPVTA